MKLTEFHDSSGSLLSALNAQRWDWRYSTFVVPKTHWVATLNGCHRDAGHQGHNCTLSLLREHFWWLGMINQMQQSIKFCVHCLQHEGATLNGCHRDAGHQGHNCTLSLLREHFWWLGMINQMQQSIKFCVHCLQHEGDLLKAPLHLIVVTTPLDLLHVDFISIETTMELNKLPRVAIVLLFQDHFMKHVLAYETPQSDRLKPLPSSCIRVTSWLYGAPASAPEGLGC